MSGGCVKFIGSEDDEGNDIELSRIHISRWMSMECIMGSYSMSCKGVVSECGECERSMNVHEVFYVDVKSLIVYKWVLAHMFECIMWMLFYYSNAYIVNETYWHLLCLYLKIMEWSVCHNSKIISKAAGNMEMKVYMLEYSHFFGWMKIMWGRTNCR